MQKLLGINTNYKTIKNQKVGVLTGILYMAPYNLSGKNVCPNASAGCASCQLDCGQINATQYGHVRPPCRPADDRLAQV